MQTKYTHITQYDSSCAVEWNLYANPETTETPEDIWEIASKEFPEFHIQYRNGKWKIQGNQDIYYHSNEPVVEMYMKLRRLWLALLWNWIMDKYKIKTYIGNKEKRSSKEKAERRCRHIWTRDIVAESSPLLIE